MAEAFADAYATRRWAAIYASPRRRALDTAAPIAARTGMTVHADERLAEIAYGAWEGESQDEIAARFPAEFQRWAADPASRGTPGGETAFQVAARAVPVVERIRERHPEGDVLIVSHKATIRIVACALLQLDVRLFRDRLGQPVAALTVFDLLERGPLLRVLGDRSHLPQRLRDLQGT